MDATYRGTAQCGQGPIRRSWHQNYRQRIRLNRRTNLEWSRPRLYRKHHGCVCQEFQPGRYRRRL